MQRTFIVTSLKFKDPKPTAQPVEVQNLGLSTLQLFKMSNMAATGVRADLQINDSSALEVLNEYYSKQTGLDWTFRFGGDKEPITIPLRWTKFDKTEGTIQVVKNVVMRDLIAEAEALSAQESTGRPNPTS